jgi:hypothetical protein
MKLSSLTGHFSQAPESLRNTIGWTKQDLEKFLQSHGNIFSVAEDEDELYDSGAFGQNNPDSLITTIWYMNTVHFGLRGSHEHRQLKWVEHQVI